MEARGISKEDYAIVGVPSREVPSYLSASDAGVAFIKPCFFETRFVADEIC